MTNNISIVWDFDRTLTSQDSTTELIRFFIGNKTQKFWDKVKKISGVEADAPVDSISTSEAPVWMYLLSEMAIHPEKKDKIALDEEQIGELIADKIELYPNVLNCLQKIKSLSSKAFYKKNNIELHHFVITAGLQDLVSSVFKIRKSDSLITKIFGCRYKVIKHQQVEKNIPIYCMDKTAKTRALFEICS